MIQKQDYENGEKTMKYMELDTPSFLVDQDIMMANIEKMQKYAGRLYKRQ